MSSVPSVYSIEYAIACAASHSFDPTSREWQGQVQPEPEPVTTPLTPEKAEEWAENVISGLGALAEHATLKICLEGGRVILDGSVTEDDKTRYNEMYTPENRELTLYPIYTPGVGYTGMWAFGMGFSCEEGIDEIAAHLLSLFGRA